LAGVAVVVLAGGGGRGVASAFAGLQLRAVRGVLVAVRRVERLLERDAAATGEAQRVGAAGDDEIPWEEAARDLDVLVVLGADLHGRLDEGVRQVEVFHEYESV